MIRDDAISALKSLGHNITEYIAKFEKYDFDDREMSCLKNSLDSSKESFDIIFSFNYFPDVSRVANEKGIPYVSWVYDNPHLTLESKTLSNDVNRVFLFDSLMVEKYKKLGVQNVYYSPLPAKINKKANNEYKHDITFVGTLYDGDKDQYGMIKYLPDNLRYRLDKIILSQHILLGFDIVDEPIKKIEKEIASYVNTSLGDNYRKCDIDIFSDILRKRVTMYDRIRALSVLGESFKTSLYCEKPHPELPVNYMGTVSNEELETVLSESKINLNLSLRSIRRGIPLRVMQILGAGGFCLTDYKEDMDGLLVEGDNIACFWSEEEMVDKCRYYLNHDDERKLIAQRGIETAKQKLSYSVLLEKIFNLVSAN